MRTTRTRPLIAALAAAAVAVTGLAANLTDAPSAEAAGASIQVMTHNLAKKDSALTGVIKKHTALKGNRFILLQEVCESMVPRLQKDLGYTTFRERRLAGNCGEGQSVGEATVWTGSGAKALAPIALNATPIDGHTYGLACLAVTRDGRSIKACSTHLIAEKADPKDRDALTAAMKGALKGLVESTDVVIVGGDFNETPKVYPMDHLYGVGKDHDGQFRELHQMATGTTARTGKVTVGGGDKARKLDYIFASVKGSRSSGGTERTCWKDGNPATTDCTTSNHRILWGKVPLKPVS